MFIKSVRLQNFMSHEDTTIEFDPVMTSITGDSESGKTNIFRGSRLTLMNGNWPEALIRDGCTQGTITIQFTDGRVVERVCSASGQRLKLVDVQGKAQLFAGKKNTDDYLRAFTGFAPVVLDESSGTEDLNFIEVGAQSLLFVGNYASIQRRTAAIVGGSQLEDAKNRLGKELRRARLALDTNLREEQRLDANVKELELFLNNVQDTKEKLAELHTKWKQANNQLVSVVKCQAQLLELGQIHHHMLIYDDPSVQNCHILLDKLTELESKSGKLMLALSLHADLAKQAETEWRIEDIIARYQETLEQLATSELVCETCGRPL